MQSKVNKLNEEHLKSQYAQNMLVNRPKGALKGHLPAININAGAERSRAMG